jgi:carboxyl-terminal processing protease
MKARFLFMWLMGSLLLAACRQEPEMPEASYSPQEIQALQLRTFESTWSTINENYVYDDFNGLDWSETHDLYADRLTEPLDETEFQAILDEMLAELPEGTAQLQSRQERIEAAAGGSQGYEGIGAFVTLRERPQPRLVLMEVMGGSPAEQAGLKAHDAILEIGGEPVEAGTAASQIARVRGEAGSKIAFTVRTPGEEPRTVEVTRGRIDQVSSRLLWHPLGNTGIGYLRFPPLEYEELLQDVVLALQTFDATGDLEALIIDLRIASAGEGWPVAPLLTMFTDGQVGEIYSREESTPVSVTGIYDFVNSQEVPLALLVGQNTTGPAEIFAAALQEAGEAVIIGMNTAGDVETIAPFYLPDGSRAMIAVFTFRTNEGHELGLHGLEPDVELDLDWDEVTEEEDQVIGVAIELLATASGE